ncbi:MAG: FKBP-type peptidyl-prolyl cis-trans isomerase [Bacteroidales bacterium]|nr:FKBP-type peptidyl-prolyl cis-trans isomerase [Bacteroidales bacterium]
MMHCGDSATFIINAKQYFNAYQYGYIPAFVNDKTMLWITLKINNIFTYEEYQQFSIQKAKEEERKQISDYLVANHIEEAPSESGLIVIKHNTTAGKPAKEGARCMVHYTGKLLNGEIFDSSVERGTPFEFTLGKGEVIKGWDEGIALLRKGEKATLIIPSELGYGERGAGGGSIPPYASLVFDVELVDVK